jgi:hypothetical protein
MAKENFGSGFVINEEKADEHRERFLLVFKKTTLRIRDEARANPIYLIRYSLFSCRWFAVKLHKIFLSDDDCLHCHPWSFISVILWGGYWECRPAPGMPAKDSHLGREIYSREHLRRDYTAHHIHANGIVRRWKSPGSVLWRPAPSVHKLELVNPATTLVITFRKKWDWGFYTRSGWKFWKDYIRSGSKCE